MYAPPTDLAEAEIAGALFVGWGVRAASLAYHPVGFGSHHWLVVAEDGARWFATVDDCEAKRLGPEEPLDGVFGRLRAAFAAARAVRDAGHGFAIAPLPAKDGAVLVRITGAYALSLYPHLDGVSHDYGEYPTLADRREVLELLVALHSVPTALAPDLGVEDFALAHRSGLEDAISALAEDWAGGPFSEPARVLLTLHAAGVKRLLDHYDGLAERARERPRVLTHGEPHAANTMRVGGRRVLLDWDTALIAPPERDLWMVADAEGEIARAYAAATGREVAPWLLDLYRLRWDLIEIAGYITQLRAAHEDDANTRESWKNLQVYLRPAERWPGLFGGGGVERRPAGA